MRDPSALDLKNGGADTTADLGGESTRKADDGTGVFAD